jgi:tRNA-uridine 2-sulfurtransferase
MARIFAGLSGGVDSAVSAALLKQEGHEVTGVFIRIQQPAFVECTMKEDRLDAMRAAAFLGIPFRELDLSAVYQEEVIRDMLADYQRGVTPNPDILCNTRIKFGHFLLWALKEGAESVATGHYARTEKEPGGAIMLLRGSDPAKDQSYFLSGLSQKELAYARFPVGGMKKNDVRAYARALGLPQAERPDSQGLCFVGAVSMQDFLARFLPLSSGPVLHEEGIAIGTHKGAALYTIGERHGFTLEKPGVPHFVTAIDTIRNTITVSSDIRDTLSKSAFVEDLHAISGELISEEAYSVETRYRDTPVSARLFRVNEGWRVDFLEPHLAVPGQFLVFYRDDVCLGAGRIAKTT